MDTVCNNSGRSRSVWMEVEFPTFPILEENSEADVCVVGGGIAGLTCAYTLAKEGKSVIVVDRGAIAGGQTARTTGHLTWFLDDRYYNLEKFFGKRGARLVAESHAAAIDFIESVVKEEKIECDFARVDAYLFLEEGDTQKTLEKEIEAIRKAGMDIAWAERAPFSSTFDTGRCLHAKKQAEFHVLKYLKGLVKAITKNGGKIYSGVHVNHVKDGKTCVVTTKEGFEIKAQSVIVATCSPINDRFMIHTKQAPYRTYVIGGAIPKGSVPKALYWDTGDPYHYIRIQKHESDPKLDWLLVGGEDHKTGQEKDIEAIYDRIEKWTRRRFKMFEKVEFRWSGQVFEPVDSLAFIGKNPEEKNVYIATGDSGNGLTHGTIAGMLIPDLIMKKSNPWRKLYEPSRKTLAAAPEFIHENANVAWQYRDWFTPGDKEKIEKLPADEGIILRKGLKKLAIYKDKKNQLHISSACCTHLGGCVRWNSCEKSWDCPCHGSRFDGSGKVITGPAYSDLPSAD